MCLRNLSIFSKVFVATLCLVALCSPLAAWPTWLGGSDSTNFQINQMKGTVAERESQIKSLQGYIKQLELQLTELLEISLKQENQSALLLDQVRLLQEQLEISRQKLTAYESEVSALKVNLSSLETQLESLISSSTASEGSDGTLKMLVEQLQRQLAASREKLLNSEKTIEILQLELQQLRTLSGLSEISLTVIAEETEALEAAYDEKADESDGYFTALVKEKTDIKIRGIVGAGGTYDPASGAFGITADLGVGYGRVSMLFGAQYTFGTLLNLGTLIYSAGLQVNF